MNRVSRQSETRRRSLESTRARLGCVRRVRPGGPDTQCLYSTGPKIWLFRSFSGVATVFDRESVNDRRGESGVGRLFLPRSFHAYSSPLRSSNVLETENEDEELGRNYVDRLYGCSSSFVRYTVFSRGPAFVESEVRRLVERKTRRVLSGETPSEV